MRLIKWLARDWWVPVYDEKSSAWGIYNLKENNAVKYGMTYRGAKRRCRRMNPRKSWLREIFKVHNVRVVGTFEEL